jgi:hypothetical protein
MEKLEPPPPVQHHLPQQEIQNRSVQAPSSSKNMLNVTTVVQQIITELSEAVPKKRQNNCHYNNGT